MASLRTCVSVGLLLSVFCASSAAQQKPPRDPQKDVEAAGTGTIAGTVTTSDGTPVARAMIVLSSQHINRSWRAITDGLGQYTFRSLPAGTYTIQVSHSRFLVGEYGQTYVSQPGRELALAVNQTLRANLIVTRGGAVTGRVFDDYAQPVSDVAVQAYRLIGEGVNQRLVQQTANVYRSNDLGEYRVSRLPPGDYYFAATPSGAGASLPDAGGAQAFAATWFPGVVAVADSRPVRVLGESEVGGLDFQLQVATLSVVTGSISAPPGVKPSDVRLQLLPAASGLTLSARLPAIVGPNGSFRIDRVPPGDYTLTAQIGSEPRWHGEPPAGSGQRTQPPDEYHAMLPIRIDSRDINDLLLTLVPARTISGRIQTDSNLPSGARPTVSSSYITSSFSGGKTAPVSQQGTFSLKASPGLIRLLVSGLPQGWIVESIQAGGKEVRTTGLLMESVDVKDVLITLSSRGSEIAGNVVGESLAPVTDYTVVVLSVDSSSRTAWGGGVKVVRPDQYGTFFVGGLRAGTYVVAAVDFIASSQYYDPAVWRKIEAAGERVTVAKGEARRLSLPFVTITK